MHITIAPAHLEAAKAQAHKILGLLDSSLFFHALPSKSDFLNRWAAVLGYHDWGDFQARTRFAHATNTATVILTPESLEPLAQSLWHKLGAPHDLLGVVEDCLACAMNSEEQALFESIDVEPPRAVEFILNLGPDDRHAYHLIEFLGLRSYGSAMHEDDMAKRFMEYMKEKRKDLPRQTVQDLKYDIYPKSGRPYPEVMSAALESGYIERYIDIEHRRSPKIRFTEEGISWWVGSSTEDFGPEWQAWYQEYRKLISLIPEGYPSDDFSWLATHFRNGVTAKMLASHKEWSARNIAEGDEIRQNIHEQTGISPDELSNHRIFHIRPRLLARAADLDLLHCKDIELTVSCNQINLHHTTGVTQPYPNRRYFVGENHFAVVPGGLTKLQVTLMWTNHAVDLAVEHTLDVILESSRAGCLYSSSTQNDHHRQWHTLPYSFYSHEAIAPYAETQEEFEQHWRVANQIETFRVKDRVVQLLERILLKNASPNEGLR